MKEKILICNCGDCDSWIVGENKLICQTCGKSIENLIASPVPDSDPDGARWTEREIKIGPQNAFNPTT